MNWRIRVVTPMPLVWAISRMRWSTSMGRRSDRLTIWATDVLPGAPARVQEAPLERREPQRLGGQRQSQATHPGRPPRQALTPTPHQRHDWPQEPITSTKHQARVDLHFAWSDGISTLLATRRVQQLVKQTCHRQWAMVPPPRTGHNPVAAGQPWDPGQQLRLDRRLLSGGAKPERCYEHQS